MHSDIDVSGTSSKILSANAWYNLCTVSFVIHVELIPEKCTFFRMLGTCPICNKVFRKKSYILHHIKSSHQRLKEHKCPHCALKFSRPYSVKVDDTLFFFLFFFVLFCSSVFLFIFIELNV